MKALVAEPRGAARSAQVGSPRGRVSALLVAATTVAAMSVGICGATPVVAAPPASAQQPVLHPGASGPAVATLQRLLGVRVTGFFGDETKAAVLRFQQSRGITATGVVATLTWGALGRTAQPAPSGQRPTLSQGMQNPWVTVLQQKLRMPNVTGYFGPITLSYVKALQRRAKLPQTGVVDSRTWRKVGKIKVTVATKAAPPAATPASGKASRVLAIAASLKGIPYVATGYDPAHGFNCSSYTQYVYERAGVDLGGAYTVWQYNKSRHITQAEARPGDLIFYYNYPNNFIGHVGIYAGNGMYWHSPRPGRSVSLDKIYSDKVLFGRVL